MKTIASLLLLALIASSSFAKNLRQQQQEQQQEISQIEVQSSEETQISYGLIFDAGSSSTKMNIYSWPCRQTNTVPKIDPQNAQTQKAKPGLATFANNLDGINGYLQPLIDFADKQIPENERKNTPIMLFGTAGLRVIPENDQKNIILKVVSIFEKSGYLFDKNWVRIITGQQEGGFMWISINYLLGNLQPKDDEQTSETVSTIDLGGASTQIAFGPNIQFSKKDNIPVVFPNYNDYDIYSVSYLGYGNDMIRDTIVKEYGIWSKDKTQIFTPCYNDGFKGQLEQGSTVVVVGTGQPRVCLDQIKQAFHLEKCDLFEQEFGCGIDGRYQPAVPLEKPIYALSGIQNAAAFFKLDSSPYTPEELQNNYQVFCNMSWHEAQVKYPDNPYLSSTCFLGLYSSALMIEGYNVPLTQLVNSPGKINGVEPSWTLGAMFYVISQLPCQEESPICQTQKQLLSSPYFQKYLKQL